jgi:hypothetical protein
VSEPGGGHPGGWERQAPGRAWQGRRQAGAAAEAAEPGAPSDSDKIFAQLRLDAACFRAQAAGLVAEQSWPSALADVLHQLDVVTTTQAIPTESQDL